MSGGKKISRLLTCCFCQFQTRSRGGFAWHQTATHGKQSGNGIRGTKRGRTAPAEIASEAGEEDGPARSRQRLDGGSLVRVVRKKGLVSASSADSTGSPIERDGSEAGAASALVATSDPLCPDERGSYDAAIRAELYALMDITGVPLEAADPILPGTSGGDFQYQTLATQVRSLYEVLDDAARSVPILERRRNSGPGRFNTTRLRALQNFVLSVGGAGLSAREQRLLYELLDVWDQSTSPLEPADDLSLRGVFPTPTSFVNALRDDIDDVVLGAGWMKLRVKEGGAVYETYYRSVLDVVVRDLLDNVSSVSLWSGETGPASPTNRRESPMDGDAFRLCETEVVGAHGARSFVLGLHLYSDASQLSWSGGMFALLVSAHVSCGVRFHDLAVGSCARAFITSPCGRL